MISQANESQGEQDGEKTEFHVCLASKSETEEDTQASESDPSRFTTGSWRGRAGG